MKIPFSIDELKFKLLNNDIVNQDFLFTKLKIKKENNDFIIDHKWRWSGLISMLALFFLLFFIFVFLFYPNFLNVLNLFENSENYFKDLEKFEYIKDWDIPISLVVVTIFSFPLFSSIDGSKKYKEDIEIELRMMKLDNFK
jgi:amino acid transporter